MKNILIMAVLVYLITLFGNPDLYPSRPVSFEGGATISLSDIGAAAWEKVSSDVKVLGEVLMMFLPLHISAYFGCYADFTGSDYGDQLHAN